MAREGTTPKKGQPKSRGDLPREEEEHGILVAGLAGAATLSQAPPLIPPGCSRHPPLLATISHRAGLRLVAMSLLPRGPAATRGNNSNFSIEHILNVAGRKQDVRFPEAEREVEGLDKKHFEWLSCTRYRPPKLPRQRKKEGATRRSLGRSPRIPFSSSQVAFLEAKFLRTPYLSSDDVSQLATYLKLSETKVKIWFQNRRAREKREKEAKSKATQTPPNNHPSRTPNALPRPPSPQHPPTPLALPITLLPSPPPPYLQLLPPLDLTQRRLVPRPK